MEESKSALQASRFPPAADAFPLLQAPFRKRRFPSVPLLARPRPVPLPPSPLPCLCHPGGSSQVAAMPVGCSLPAWRGGQDTHAFIPGLSTAREAAKRSCPRLLRAGDARMAQLLHPPGHAMVRWWLKLLLRRSCKLGRGGRGLVQIPEAHTTTAKSFQRSHSHAAGLGVVSHCFPPGWGSHLNAPLAADKSPTMSQALGLRQRHPRSTEGSVAPVPRLQASLQVLGTGGAAAHPAPGSTWEGAVSGATSAPSFFPFPFQHSTPSNSRGDALHKETSMHRALEETKINSEGRWLLPDLRWLLCNLSPGLCRGAELLPIKHPLPLAWFL